MANPTKEEVFSVLCALLSSGHYTESTEDGYSDFRKEDNGRDWEKYGNHSRFTCSALTDAIHIADQTYDELEIQ